MIITLSLYIVTIIMPFLSFNKCLTYKIGGVKKKLSIKKMYWLWVAILFSFISITTKTYTDLEVYTNIFDWTNTGGTNYDTFGWCLLCRIFYWIGLSYRGMIPFVLLFSYFIISRACRRINIEEDKIIAGMMVFPGLMNLIQLKFFLACSIIIYSVTFLQRTEKWSLLKFSIGIIFATLIHSASIFCFVYLFVIMFERISVKKSVFYTFLGICGMLAILKAVPSIASYFLNAQKVLRYFTGAVEVSSINWIVEISIAWNLMVITAWMVIRGGNVSNNLSGIATLSARVKNERHIFALRSFAIICLNGIILPLLIYDQNFHRFVEIEYMIGYEVLTFYYQNKLFKGKNNKFFIVAFALISILFCMRYFIAFDKVMPLFEIDELVTLLR